MTRKELKDMLPILQAWAEGKTIHCNFGDGWRDADIDLDLSLGDISKFRIKPEQKYRPFRTQEECWNEMLKHQPFGWLKSKVTGSYRYICEVACSEGYGGVAITSCTYEPFLRCSKSVYIDYTFADGTPFGIMTG